MSAMHRNLPPLNALRAFEAAGRHGSFTGAAEELNVSHSAISRHVRGLEKRLQVQLFRAESRGVMLTAAGQKYLAELTPVFDRISAATDALQPRAESEVAVNSDPLLAERWLMPRLGAFYRAYPQIRIRLIASERLANLEQHEADLALRFFLRADKAGENALLFDTPVYPYGAASLSRSVRNPGDFTCHTLLSEREGEPWKHWFLTAGLKPEEIPETPRQLSAALSIAAAISGQGIILTNGELLERELADGRLVRLSDIGLGGSSYNIVARAGARRNKAVRNFTDWLLSEATRGAKDNNQPNG